MAINTLTIVMLSTRVLLAFVYVYLFTFMRAGYKKSVESGYPNRFFQAFVYVFFILIIAQLVFSLDNFFQEFVPNFPNIKAEFGYKPEGGDETIGIFFNMDRPLYIFFYIILGLLFVAQSFPLEQILEWKRKPITFFILISSLALIPIFIPVLTYTLYFPIVMLIYFIGIVFGFFLIIGVNLKLFSKSTGAIRKRSLYSVISFFLLYGGFYIALETVGIAGSYDVDIIVGSCLQIIASFFYRAGFNQKD